MEKTKILGIAPYEGILTLMKQVSEKRDDIELTAYVGDLKKGLDITSKYTVNDFDVIVSRGGTAELIQETSSIPVVEIQLSVYDILRSIKLAQNINNKYAIVGFPSITKNAHFLCDILRYNIDIYTIHNESEADQVLMELSANGYYMVLCDMITYSLAQRYGLTAILITSGIESIETAFDQAVKTKKTYDSLTAQIKFFNTLIEEKPLNMYVYNDKAELIYYSKNEKLPEQITEEMANQFSSLLEEKEVKIYKDVDSLLYVITGVCKVIQDQLFVIYYINSRKVPLAMIKDGIRHMNTEDAHGIYYNSFYGITQSLPDTEASIETYAKSGLPVLISGEEGTGKTQLACLLYTKSNSHRNPLIQVDLYKVASCCWQFFTEHSNSPLSDTNTTLYFKNIETLPEERFEELFYIIKNLNLHRKNRIIFSFSALENEAMRSRYNKLLNHFSCLRIHIPALRERTGDIPNLSSIYFSSLNMRMAKGILGFEPDAMSLMQGYGWPGNYNQFRRVLDELATATAGPYIKASLVTNTLKKELPFAAGREDRLELFLAKKTLEEINIDILSHVLAEENGNQSAAAKRLGISRTTLWRMLQKTS